MKSAILFCMLFLLSAAHLSAQQKGWIPAGSLKIYYEKTGKGKPIVFLHAGYMDHAMWSKQVAFFSRTNMVITIDQPRHGLTTGNDSTTLIADVLRICLDSLHIKKASFAGLSLGGVSIADFAIAYPDRLDKLIFVCAGLNGFADVIKTDSVTQAVFDRIKAANETEQIKEVARVFTINWCDGPFRKPKEVDPAVRDYVYNHVVSTLDSQLNNHAPVFKMDPVAAARIGEIKNKTLIICADKDVPLILSVGNYLHEKIRYSTLRVIHGSAHMVNMEKPDEFNAMVSMFLE